MEKRRKIRKEAEDQGDAEEEEEAEQTDVREQEEEGEECEAHLSATDEHGALVSTSNPANSAAPGSAVLAPTSTDVEHYGQTLPSEYRDISDLLNLPQIEAARRLGMPMSTLSKRWKEAVRVRKWPYRQVAKLDKEIMTLLHNIPTSNEGEAPSPTPPEIEQALGVLLRRRQEELRPVRIRL